MTPRYEFLPIKYVEEELKKERKKGLSSRGFDLGATLNIWEDYKKNSKFDYAGILASSKYDDGYDQGAKDVIDLFHLGYELDYIESLTPGQRQECLKAESKEEK